MVAQLKTSRTSRLALIAVTILAAAAISSTGIKRLSVTTMSMNIGPTVVLQA
jgi:hypothetical protein